MGSQKVGRAKENSRIHLKIQKDPHLGKKTQGPKNIPNGLEAPRASLNGSKIAKETPSWVKTVNQIPSKVKYHERTLLWV